MSEMSVSPDPVFNVWGRVDYELPDLGDEIVKQLRKAEARIAAQTAQLGKKIASGLSANISKGITDSLSGIRAPVVPARQASRTALTDEQRADVLRTKRLNAEARNRDSTLRAQKAVETRAAIGTTSREIERIAADNRKKELESLKQANKLKIIQEKRAQKIADQARAARIAAERQATILAARAARAAEKQQKDAATLAERAARTAERLRIREAKEVERAARANTRAQERAQAQAERASRQRVAMIKREREATRRAIATNSNDFIEGFFGNRIPAAFTVFGLAARRAISSNILNPLQGVSTVASGVFGQVSSIATRAFESAGTAIRATLTGLTIGIGAAAAGAVALAGSSVLEASNFQEFAEPINSVFDEAAASVFKFGEAGAQAIGLSKTAALDAQFQFGTMGQTIGLSGDQLANFAQKFTVLASDFAAFRNTTPEEAIRSISSALAGENEPIRKYGIQISDLLLRTKALELGITDSLGVVLTPMQRMTATAVLIEEQGGAAIGNFTKTIDNFANLLRIIPAQFADIRLAAGKAFLPGLENILNTVSDEVMPAFLAEVERLAPRIEPAFTRIGKSISRVLSAGATGGFNGIFVRTLTEALESLAPLSEKAADVIIPLLDTFQSLFENQGLGAVFKSVVAGLEESTGSLGPLVDELGYNFKLIDDIAGDSFTRFLATLLTSVGQIGTRLAPLLLEFATDITPPLTRALATILDLFSGVIGTAVTELLDIASVLLPTFAKVIADVQPVFSQVLDGLIPTLTESLTVIGGSFEKSIPALGEIITNSLKQIIPAIGGLVQTVLPALAKFIDTYGDDILDVTGDILGTLGQVTAQISPLIGDLIADLFPIIGDFLATSGPLLRDLLNVLAPAIVDATKTLAPALSEFLQEFGAEFIQLMSDLTPALIQLTRDLLPIIQELVEITGAIISSDLVTSSLPYLILLFSGLRFASLGAKFGIGAVQGVMKLFTKTSEKANKFLKIFTGNTDDLAKKSGAAKGALSGAAGAADDMAVKTFKVGQAADLASSRTKVFTNISSGFKNVISKIGSPLGTVARTVGEFATKLRLGSVATTVFRFAGRALLGTMLAALGPIGAVVAGVAAVAIGAYEIYKNWDSIKKFFSGIWEGISDGANRLITYFAQKFAPKILEYFNLYEKLKKSGKAMIQGFMDGIRSMAGKLGETVGKVINKARDFFPNSPARTGPFSGRGWVDRSGQSVITGFADGILNKENYLSTSVDRVLSDARSLLDMGIDPALAGLPINGIGDVIAANGALGGPSIEIPISGVGEEPERLARIVERRLVKNLRR